MIQSTPKKETTTSRLTRLVVVLISILIVTPMLNQGLEGLMPAVDGNLLAQASASSAVLGTTSNDAATNPPKPQIAFDDSTGNLYSVWQSFYQANGTNQVIFAEKQSGSGEFQISDPIANTTNDLDSPPAPKLSVDSNNGDVYVVWQSFNNTSSSMDVMFAKRPGGSAEFSIGLGDQGASLNEGAADNSEKSPAIALDRDTGEIFVAWVQSGEILVANSTNGGTSFNVTTAVSADEIEDVPSTIQIAVGDSANSLYLTWKDQSADTDSADIFFSRSTDGGLSYASPVNLSQTGQESVFPTMFSSGDGETVSIAWQELVDSADEGGTPTFDIFMVQSTDGGESFGEARNLSSSDGIDSINPSIGSSPDKTKMFLAWEELSFVSLTANIFVLFSDDGGSTLGCPTKVGSTTDFSGGNTQLVGDNDGGAYAVWEEINQETFSTNDIIFFDNLGYQTPYVTLNLESNNPDTDFDGAVESKWGIEGETVTVSGKIANANEANGDFVRVDWGDGVSVHDSTISLSACSWEATSHIYDKASSALGIVQVSASLLDGSTEDTLATSETPISVAIKSHTTELTLNPIPSVIAGSDATVSGALLDLDTEEGIEGMPIFFDGTGTDSGLSSQTPSTESGGAFSSSAASSSDVASEWTVQAHFTGDTGYEFSDSSIQYYDTVSPNATQIDVTDTGPNVDVNLTDLGAKVTFENIDSLADGKLYVSECAPSNSSRFFALVENNAGTCLEISPGVQMAAGSKATITLSYDNATIPTGYNETDIDLFHAISTDQTTFVDISQSRDTDGNTISGTTSFFGMFIAGAAIHSEPSSQSAVRQQIYLGDGGTVEFRDVDDPTNSTAHISLNKSSYKVTETATLTITDNSNANFHPDVIDTIKANVSSTTSGEDGGITITLAETGVDTGIFKGTFTFKNSGTSSGTTLLVSTRDDLAISYQAPLGGRIRATFNGVTESGLVEMSDLAITPDSTPFNPVGYAVNLKLIDAQVDPEGSLTVTLSYANAKLAGSDERYLRLFQGEDLGDGTVNWNSTPISTADGDGFTIGLDSDAKTITATTSIPQGVFLLGFDIGSPGGAGGGLGGGGKGVVVDFVATLARANIGGGGGGGALNTPVNTENSVSDTTSVTTGQDVTSNVDLAASDHDLQLRFDSVIKSGTITVRENDPAKMSGLFVSVTNPDTSSSNSIGMLLVDGSESQTVGKVLDIDASELSFEGHVYLTVPYDEALLAGTGHTESDIRLLHYTGTGWEDTTTSIDMESNTVTGIMNSLSPISVVLVKDGTFGSNYIEAHPLEALKFTGGASFYDSQQQIVASTSSPNEKISVAASLENSQRISQSYAFIVQILDSDGAVVSLNWSTGDLAGGQSVNASTSWMPSESGDYTATIFVFSGDPSSSGRLLYPLTFAKTIGPLHIVSADSE